MIDSLVQYRSLPWKTLDAKRQIASGVALHHVYYLHFDLDVAIDQFIDAPGHLAINAGKFFCGHTIIDVALLIVLVLHLLLRFNKTLESFPHAVQGTRKAGGVARLYLQAGHIACGHFLRKRHRFFWLAAQKARHIARKKPAD